VGLDSGKKKKKEKFETSCPRKLLISEANIRWNTAASTGDMAKKPDDISAAVETP